MRNKVALFGLVVLFVLAAPASAQQTLRLPGGVQVTIAEMGEVSDPEGRKTIRTRLTFEEVGDLDARQLSVVSDLFFELYLGPFAEQRGYKIAQVGMKSARPKADENEAAGLPGGVAFQYERADNGVWNPQHDSTLDDDPISRGQKIKLASGAELYVEYQGTAYVSTLQAEAFVGAFWSEIPLTDMPTLYPHAREYWMLFKDAIPAHIQIAHVVAYGTPKLGYFHFRDAFAIQLSRSGSGTWPDLPKTWAAAEQARTGLVETSFRADRIRTIWPDH